MAGKFTEEFMGSQMAAGRSGTVSSVIDEALPLSLIHI